MEVHSQKFTKLNQMHFRSTFERIRVEHHRFLQLLLIAALIRILVMPFFGHIDFLSEGRRIYHAWDTAYLYPGSRFVTSLIELINFAIVSPLLAEKSSMFQMTNWVETTATHLEYFGFVSHHAILRTFFLLKIPFFVCDIVTGILLYRFFNDKKDGLFAGIVWFFNPVTFFASFIFGRYESIPLMFLAASFLMLKKERMLWGVVFFGLAMWSREILITLFPFLVIYLFKYYRRNYKSLVFNIGILLLFAGFASNILPNAFGFPKLSGDAGKTVDVFGASQSLQLFGFQIGYYYAFAMAYSLLFFHFLFSKKITIDFLIQTIAIYYCAFFASSIHTVHYVAWGFVPFTILAAKNHSYAKALGLFCVIWAGFWAIATDLGVFTQWLAIPSSLFWSNLPVLPAIIGDYLSGSALTLSHLIYASRSVYAAILIFMIILTINDIRRSSHTEL